MTPVGPERLSDHVSLGVLTRISRPDVVDAIIERTGALQQRNASVSDWRTVACVRGGAGADSWQ